jgi:flagellar hook-associated protein 1 FlgK
LAGKGLALAQLAQTRSRIDTIAKGIIDAVNTVQAGGVDLEGKPGQKLFEGTGAGNITVVAKDGSAIATAPAGAGAKSRDATNLSALRSALGAADPSGKIDAVLFDISSAVAGRKLTRDALSSIASSATIALQTQAGVDIDQEMVNLVQFQQAFQASGRVMQVASDVFDTILGIR